MEGIRTRSQRQLETDQRRFGNTTPQTSEGQLLTTEAGRSSAPASAAPDLGALMMMLQEQARRQEEQAHRLKEQLQRGQEEQARQQEEQAGQQEEQARRLEEQLQRGQEEQARQQEEQGRRLEEQFLLMKDLHATFGKEIKEVKDRVAQHDNRLSEAETRIDQVKNRVDNVMVDVKKMLNDLKIGDGVTAPVVATTPSLRGFKVPPFDRSFSWSAYKIQFAAVMKANGWNKSQAITALTLGLRDQALTVLEALGKDMTYEQLLEALEARYGDAHLEHVFRAQLKDRVQRSNENLQQWALEVEKLVRKAYQSVPALIVGNLVQTFIDGIRDLEVRAVVRLGHHEMLKDALTHALEVEAVRQDHRSHRVREVAAATVQDRNKGYSPRCYGCGERGYLRSSCPKRTVGGDRSREGSVADSTAQQQQGNWRVLADVKRAPRISISQTRDGNSLIIKGEVNGKPWHGCQFPTYKSVSWGLRIQPRTH
ncbi:unnamed protein product [Parnassius mnemosyne]|uniref:CCHC-type domain-containing protein n=1 Tax=Parnassius mnemosyne TaxID=213953 RepID=A0AAV1LQ25_9NEOP